MWHKNCTRKVSDLTYPSCGFNEFDNNTYGDNSNSNYNDNDNKNKNIKNDNVQLCNILFRLIQYITLQVQFVGQQ